jgi:hypothetical protein
MPGKRAGHTSTAVGRKIFVFGGSCGPEYLSDFFVLDTDPPPVVRVTSSSCVRGLEHKLLEYFNETEFSDVTFVIQNKKIYAHRLILATASEYFKAMFLTGFREGGTSEIAIPFVSYDSFLDVVKYIYCGRLPAFENVAVAQTGGAGEKGAASQRTYSNGGEGDGYSSGGAPRNIPSTNQSGDGGLMDGYVGSDDDNDIVHQTESGVGMGMSYEEDGFLRGDGGAYGSRNGLSEGGVSEDEGGKGGDRDSVLVKSPVHGRMTPAQLEKACEILEMSDQYMLDHLKQVMEKLLTYEVTEETVDFLLTHAVNCQAEQLGNYCQYFARNNSSIVGGESGESEREGEGLSGHFMKMTMGD